ncbi:MAG: HU family DNA-binding protein [Paludibacteraceae bacterium]|nr:HU family DNA-binding protein [Paludibacteraceae bacterium]
MAENKLIWSELRRTLAERSNMSEKDATSFLNAFQSQIVEALKQDKQVKINGLGTFRLQPVAARKSVDVNSGEEITIEGYNKIVFAPEAGVKELVEKVNPLSIQSSDDDEPAEIDPIQKLGVQAEEIVGILDELGQSPEPVAAEPAPEPDPQPEPEPEPVAAEPAPEPVFIPEPSFVREPEPGPEPEEPEKKSHWGRALLIILLILLVLAVLAYFFLPRPLMHEWKDKGLNWWKNTFQKEQVAAPAEPEDPNAIPDSILAEFEAICGDDEEVWDEIQYNQFIKTEPMHEASRLCWMAYRFYGNKEYWPYLYDANKDRIDDPNVIDTGTPIRVPKLTKEQLDLSNDRTRRQLEYLRRQAEKKMR